MIQLTQLAIYPIKSCSQISLKQSEISPFGLAMDRRWMLIDENGQMLTQRKLARMCLIDSQLDDDSLILNAPGMPSLTVSPSVTANVLKATVWEDTCSSLDCGDQAAVWLSDFLQHKARLVYFPENEIRQCDENYAQKGDITAFSDGFPYLLISQASLEDLNSRLDQAIEMKRFRPNLVVSGNSAFAEDQWKRIRIGEVIFRVVKPCSRCVIPSIDPDTAEKSAEPVKTLASYRKTGNKVFFGQNLIAENSGHLMLGMDVEILE